MVSSNSKQIFGFYPDLFKFVLHPNSPPACIETSKYLAQLQLLSNEFFLGTKFILSQCPLLQEDLIFNASPLEFSHPPIFEGHVTHASRSTGIE